MGITYTWKVTGMKVKTAGEIPQAVFQTYWQKIGTDEHGNQGVFSGATPLDVSKIDPNNFTPLENLTEEQVLEWIKAVVIGDYEQHVNAQIAKQLSEKTATIEEVKLPWAPVEDIPSVTPPGTPPAP